MKKIINVLFLFMIIAVTAQEKSKSKLVEVKVSGLCEMCKARIEKAAFKVRGVKSAEWDVDEKMLHLIINEYKTDVLTIQNKMASIGHDTEAVLATDEAYSGLHGCCKYQRSLEVKKAACCAKNCTKPCCKDKKQGEKTCAEKKE